jgi:hypothetical protein
MKIIALITISLLLFSCAKDSDTTKPPSILKKELLITKTNTSELSYFMLTESNKNKSLNLDNEYGLWHLDGENLNRRLILAPSAAFFIMGCTGIINDTFVTVYAAIKRIGIVKNGQISLPEQHVEGELIDDYIDNWPCGWGKEEKLDYSYSIVNQKLTLINKQSGTLQNATKIADLDEIEGLAEQTEQNDQEALTDTCTSTNGAKNVSYKLSGSVLKLSLTNFTINGNSEFTCKLESSESYDCGKVGLKTYLYAHMSQVKLLTLSKANFDYGDSTVFSGACN